MHRLYSFLLIENNKGVGQTAQTHRLIYTFVVCTKQKALRALLMRLLTIL